MNTDKKEIACKSGPTNLAKPRFGPGMILQHDDLEQITTYTTDMFRLIIKSLLGSGVICGLDVDIVENANQGGSAFSFTVSPGVALDPGGYPIEVPSIVTVQAYPDAVVLDGVYCVYLSRKALRCAKRSSACDSEGRDGVFTREIEEFVIRVVPKVDRPAEITPKDFYSGVCIPESQQYPEVLLAEITKTTNTYKADNTVRRSLRPLLSTHEKSVAQEELQDELLPTPGDE